MTYQSKRGNMSTLFFSIALSTFAIITIFFIGSFHEATAAPTDLHSDHDHTTITSDKNSFATNISRVPDAACAGGPVIDGITLDECFIQNFNVGGTAKSITVWYTKNAITATRMVDGNPVILEHWINSDAEAQQVAQWGQEAWERFYEVFGRHPYDTGCSNNINVQMEEGVGWSGIAYWASPGNCNIGIDSPMVRNGGGQKTVYHEFQHYVQYSFNDGCYDNIRNNYNGGAADGNAEYVEGYADLASDAVDAGVDSWYYGNSVASYNPADSLFNKNYFDVYNKYYMEQTGSNWVPIDPHHHLDAVRAHYEECDAQDSIYVIDTVIPSLTGGALSEEELFFNFFAANWAKDWADANTQPELVYTDDDGNPYGAISLAQNVNISTGTKSWTNEMTPDVWGGQYYQVKPQAGCDYVTVVVDGEAGAKLGINLMAADTVGSTSVSRSGWIGEDFSRTFAADGVHHRIVAVVNSFKKKYAYDVSFTCVTPTLNILEPRQNPNFTLVGEPASPIAYLSRLKVTSDGIPVRGLPASSFSFDAEGDAINIVSGSFQEVGEEYWAILLPPVKSAGTTFVDMKACLDSAICDTETDSLLYVAPGNSDLAMVFDGSGSMTTEDVPGEGTRLVNAQKAGTVMADLLQNGDRVLVMDFSAENVPVGCGLPGGDGNCPLDINTYLNRTDVTVGTIATVKNAIDMVNAREWTPIGGALVEAKNKLQAAPYSLNPKHIVLLSDGEENVNPLYADVRDELIDSGIIINTVGFSSEAPEALLAQIAADTGGTYRFVPTTVTGSRVPNQLNQQAETLIAQGIDSNIVTALTANSYLPGPLALDNVYEYLETEAQGASRIGHFVDENPAFYEWTQTTAYVDDSATSLRLVIATREADQPVSCGATFREAQVLPPGGNPRSDWVVVNSGLVSGAPVPGNWDIRNSLYDDVIIISAPDPGTWTVRARYSTYICREEEEPRPTAGYPFMINSSIQSDYRLQGRFMAPIMNNQGVAGDNVPIVATLMERTGTIPGATVLGLIEKPNGNSVILFYDDGEHNDGAADDGIYGANFPQTDVGGTYNVRLLAGFDDPAGSGESLLREWLGAFWIDGPESDKPNNLDQDGDGLPDPWEERCNLDTNSNSLTDDNDLDGLNNGEEFARGTLPCDADTDNGGERDGSEVDNGRNPLNSKDDFVRPFGHITIRPLDASILIQWTRPLSYTNVFAIGSTDPGQLGYPVSIGNSGEFIITGLENEQTYYVTLVGQNGSAIGDYSEPIVVTPKVDPVPPMGAILINNGALETTSREVVLNIAAVDDLMEGPAKYATAEQRAAVPVLNATTASGIAEMRIANNPSFTGVSWEPYATEKVWTLGEFDSDVHVVYAQFRDSAGNESAVVVDDILFTSRMLYLPMIIR